MSAPDLIAFLRARLDEDEVKAKAATPGPWWHNPLKQWLDAEAFEKYDLTKGEEFVGYGGPHPFTGAIAITGRPSTVDAITNAAHIARHDPARVLAEVAAKRAIVDLHYGSHECPSEDSSCGWWTKEPCPTIRALALPYADHPDYRPEWMSTDG